MFSSSSFFFLTLIYFLCFIVAPESGEQESKENGGN